MRKDFKIAIILMVASIPAGAFVAALFEYVPALKQYPGASTWASGLVTLALIVWALLEAIKGEKAAEKEGKKNRMIPLVGMIASLLSFLVFAGWYFLPDKSANVAIPTELTTPFAALLMRSPKLDLDHKQSTDEWAATMYFDVFNSSEQFLDYEATLTGEANSLTADNKVSTITGLIRPKDTTRLIYGRIAPISIVNSKDIKIPALRAQLNYSIRYGIHESGKFDRLSSKTLHFELLSYNPNPVGTVTEMPVNVLFSDEIER